MFSPSGSEHVNDDNEVLSLLKRADVILKLNKWAFSNSKVDYLGRKIISGRLEAASVPAKVIMEAPFSTEKRGCEPFRAAVTSTGRSYLSLPGSRNR